MPKGVQRNDVVEAAGVALKAVGSTRDEHAFKQLDAWSVKRSIPPFALFEATLSLDQDGDWLKAALAPVVQVLRKAINESAVDVASAKSFSGNVEGWLGLTGYAGDAITSQGN